MSNYAEPVVGKEFFAREDLLRSLLQSAKDIQDGYRQNTALIGSGLIGKSSLLLQFLSSIKDSDKLLPVYLNLKDTGFEAFVFNFATRLLYHSLKKDKKVKESYGLDYLLRCAKGVFPKSCDIIKRVRRFVTHKRYDEAFSELWDLCVILNNESGFFPVITLDEFSLLSDFPVKRPYQVLGQKIMVQQKTLFLLSSSFSINARKILSEKLSLLFGGFKILDIDTFEPSEAKRFLLSRCKSVAIPGDIRDFILAFTNGHPFYLSSIMRKIDSAKSYGTDKITVKSLSRIIAELLFYPGGTVDQFFGNTLASIRTAVPKSSLFDILAFIVKPARIRDILSRNVIPTSELNIILKSLLELGLIAKSGMLYSISDPVFRMWIEVKSKPRNLCFDFIPQQERVDYPVCVEEKITNFCLERKKSLDKRIVELISSFNDDHFFIDERVRILPRVNSIRLKRIYGNSLLIAAKAKKKCLFVVLRKLVTEEDVCNISEKVRVLKKSKPKIVLIAPNGVEAGAKLMAKQKRYWIWAEEDITKLFKFYKGYNALIA